MRIGFNFMPYTPGGQGGSEVYLSNVIREISHLDRRHDFYLFGGKESVQAYNPGVANFHTIETPQLFSRSRASRILGEQFYLPFICAKHKLDYLISNYVVPLLAPCKQIVILHDVLFKRYLETLEPMKLVYWRSMLPASVLRSQTVLTVSQFSSNEIVELIPGAQGKICVTVEGVRPALQSSINIESVREVSRLGIRHPFFLCVATFGHHKNIKKLVEAFHKVSGIRSDVSLVLVGGAHTPDAKSYRDELQVMINELGLNEKITFLGHVTDSELAALYRETLALVLPSLYEGFGLPIIEAQSFGSPVLCSNVASMPEVAGEAALTFDPTSVASIAEKLVLIMDDDGLRRTMGEASLKNVQRFTWDKAAKTILALLDSQDFAAAGTKILEK